LTGTFVKRAKEEEDMADEEIRTDEEPEVEAHGAGAGADKVEADVQAHDDDDSDDVEAHGFRPGEIEGEIEGTIPV
jgi:hypothetical protein